MKKSLIPAYSNEKYLIIQYFLLIFLFLSSCVSVHIDATREINAGSEFQKLPAGVLQHWKLQVPDEEIDNIYPFRNNYVIASTIKINHYLTGIIYTFKYSGLSLIDLNNGKMIWTFPCIDLEQKSQKIVALSPLIILMTESDTQTGYYAVSPENGTLTWKYLLNGKPSYCLSDDLQFLYLACHEKDNLTIQKLSLTDGKQEWNNTLNNSDIQSNGYTQLLPGPDLYLTAGDQIISINKNDGTIRWNNNLKNGIDVLFTSNNLVWMYNDHQAESIQASDGRVINSFTTPDNRINRAIVYDPYLFMNLKDTLSGRQQIACYQIEDQKLTWNFPLESDLKSSIYMDAGHLFFSTVNTFYNIDPRTGIKNYEVKLPGNPNIRSVIFDDIQKNNDQFIICRENGIITISEKNKSVTLNNSFGYSGGFTPGYIQNKISEYNLLLSNGDIGKAHQSMNLYYDKSAVNLARQNQVYVYNSTASTLSGNSNAGYTEKMNAYGKREMATQSAYSQGRYQAEMQMMNASTQFGAALGNAIGAALMVKVGESTREGLEYAGEKINTLVRYHMTSVHHDLNLHPYFDRGWRLALIHLEDGTHASIPMVPDLIALRYSITNSVIYNYFENENKKYLIVKALIPTTQIPDSYKLRIFNNTNGKMDEWMLPKPYIVCYDITGLETDEKPLNAEEVSMASPGIDQKLVEEAFFSNKEAVVKEIREGADVNGKDIYGHTALMHACQRGDIKTIKFLLSRNANPRTPDPEGFNAMDYIFMPASKRMPITIQQLARVIKKLKKAGKKFS